MLESVIAVFIITRTSLLVTISFFFHDTATTEIYTLSLHDALPIWSTLMSGTSLCASQYSNGPNQNFFGPFEYRSEEHTSELQSHSDLVCRLLLEKKKKKKKMIAKTTKRL